MNFIHWMMKNIFPCINDRLRISPPGTWSGRWPEVGTLELISPGRQKLKSILVHNMFLLSSHSELRDDWCPSHVGSAPEHLVT